MCGCVCVWAIVSSLSSTFLNTTYIFIHYMEFFLSLGLLVNTCHIPATWIRKKSLRMMMTFIIFIYSTVGFSFVFMYNLLLLFTGKWKFVLLWKLIFFAAAERTRQKYRWKTSTLYIATAISLLMQLPSIYLFSSFFSISYFEDVKNEIYISMLAF